MYKILHYYFIQVNPAWNRINPVLPRGLSSNLFKLRGQALR